MFVDTLNRILLLEHAQKDSVRSFRSFVVVFVIFVVSFNENNEVNIFHSFFHSLWMKLMLSGFLYEVSKSSIERASISIEYLETKMW